MNLPTMRITGQCRPDRGTIDGSGADRDYRMSTHGTSATLNRRTSMSGSEPFTDISG